MARDPFQMAAEAEKHVLTVTLTATLDDGKPIAFKLRPALWGDLIALGWSMPEFGTRTWADLEPHEKTEAYDLRKKLACLCMQSARVVTQAEDGTFSEEWRTCALVENAAQITNAHTLTVDQFDRIQPGGVFILGGAVLQNTDIDISELAQLPGIKEENFRVGQEQPGDAGSNGGDVLDPAPRVAAESA